MDPHATSTDSSSKGASTNCIPTYTIVNGISRLSPDPGYTITTPGLPRTQLRGFKTITHLEALSDTPEDPAISNLLSPEDSDINQVDAARVFDQTNNKSADHLEVQVRTSQL
jgi:hypothetical protein